MDEDRRDQAWPDGAARTTTLISRSRDVCAADLSRRSVHGGAGRNPLAPQGYTKGGNDFRPPLPVGGEEPMCSQPYQRPHYGRGGAKRGGRKSNRYPSTLSAIWHTRKRADITQYRIELT